MRPLFLTVLLGLTLCVFTACSDNEQVQKKKTGGFHHPDNTEYPPDQTGPGNPDNGEVHPSGPPSAEATPTPDSQPAVANPSPSPKQGDYAYGVPVPGKTGFVTSPYAPKDGYVDVRGYPPGTEVKDPYTQKIFLVP